MWLLGHRESTLIKVGNSRDRNNVETDIWHKSLNHIINEVLRDNLRVMLTCLTN